MLNNVMPQRGVFFSLLTSHTDRWWPPPTPPCA
jgi:hypothetical protein